ncbi:MAG: hypothetical protein Q8K63_06490 [Acidimicrobiales bacterium]|nr:hypothetical protein [Acidimicrobiales bacterium]
MTTDDEADTSATDSNEADDVTELSEEDARNPKLHKLSQEAKNHRLAKNAAQQEVAQLKERLAKLEDAKASDELTAENRTLRLRLAFDRATLSANFKDTDAAWKLAEDDLKGVDITDGTVDANRLGEIVNHLITRYPYLVEDAGSADETKDRFPDATSGRPANGRRQRDAVTSTEVLARKFPALRNR